MDRRKSATLISGTGFEHGKPLHASRAVGASHIGPISRRPISSMHGHSKQPKLSAKQEAHLVALNDGDEHMFTITRSTIYLTSPAAAPRGALTDQ